MSGHVVIVGGGLSGLAAGVNLASLGFHVTLLEQKPALGGRAYSFKDSVTGDTIDNGQHVLIAGYTKTMRFLETIGTSHLLRIQPSPSLLFHHPGLGFKEFRLPSLPMPLNLAAGILQCSLFSFPDRLRLLQAGLSLKQVDRAREQRLAGQTIREWLMDTGQSDECVRCFWEPLAVSIMNEHVTNACALTFVRALRSAFLGGSTHAALAIPSVGLSDLYVDSAKQYITLRGGDIQCSADVTGIDVRDNCATGVRLRTGTRISADAVVVAVPFHKLLDILPERLALELSGINSMGVSPIVSLHLWFTQEFMDHDFVGLIGRRIQWLFNKRKLNGESGAGSHVSAVVSAAYGFVDKSKDELVKMAVEDIQSAYPSLSETPYHAVVVREKRATYASTPRSEAARPLNATSVPNVCIAGDWTATGFPATIESAVVSAELAVGLVVDYLHKRIH